MKNQKFMGIVFAIALVATLVPTSFADNSVTITGEVNSGLAMDAGADPAGMEVSPMIDADPHQFTDTDVTTLTIQNNDPLGFDITVQLDGSASTAAPNTLSYEGGATDISLATEGGAIGFASVETAELANGTDEVYGVFTTADLVYTSSTGDDAQCIDGTVVVTYTLTVDEEVAPVVYVGVAVYTITVL